MKAIDTNVVIRYLVRDDDFQAEIAEAIIEHKCYISHTVLVESVWLLSSYYALSRDKIAMALGELLSLPSTSTVDYDLVTWAIKRYQLGADFADMIHLIDGRSADQFVTFDKAIAKAAGNDAPIPIETLKS